LNENEVIIIKNLKIKMLDKTSAQKKKQVVLIDMKSGENLENDIYRVKNDFRREGCSNNSYLHDNVD